MDYKMEELVPIVAGLAEKYTANESTSITYEKAEQLMGAVLYCIHKAEQDERNTLISGEGVPARQMYERGLLLAEEKVKMALELYNEMIPGFNSYGNRCLHDTFIKGMPEFFKWYDIRFDPQNTILTLDYPVRKDLSKYMGIDRIYEYILCIRKEQEYLSSFSDDYVREALRGYHSEYEELVENICEIVEEAASK